MLQPDGRLAEAAGRVVATASQALRVLADSQEKARARLAGDMAASAREHARAASMAVAEQTALADRRASLLATLCPHALADLPVLPAGSDLMAAASYVRVGRVQGKSAHEPELPLVLPLLDRGHVVVRGEPEAGPILESVRVITLQALLGTGPGQLLLYGFDPELRGVFAPFGPLGRPPGIDQVGATSEDFTKLLDRLTEQVRLVTGYQRGREITLGELRSETGQLLAPYHLVVILDFPRRFSPAALDRLATLMRRGPQRGISFLIHHNTSVVAEDGVDPERIVEGAEVITCGASRATCSALPGIPVVLDRIPPAVFAEAVLAAQTSAREVAAPSLRLAEVLDPPGVARHRSSARGIAARVGWRGVEPFELMLGDEREQLHHALVTGTGGSGKSNFLKVLIHAIADRYDPEEVEFYLLDLKHGMSFHSLAYTRESPDWLPHVTVIGYESRQFAVAVLDRLVGEFAARAAAIRPFGDKISQYRDQVPDRPMPRVVAVIDEFQELFREQDELSDTALGLLEDIARKGRAYGIHLVLASQSISGIAKLMARNDGIYAQFGIRVAFRNNEVESRAVLSNDNLAAIELTSPGDAIINVAFGQPSGNHRVRVAEADQTELERIRLEAWRRRPPHANPPAVFDGARPASLADPAVVDRLRELRARARLHGQAPRVAVVGMQVALPLRATGVALSREFGRHLGIFGAGQRPGAADSGQNLAIGALQAAMVSLAVQHPAGDAEFILLDLLTPTEFTQSGMDTVAGLLRRLGFPLQRVGRAEVGQRLRELAAILESPETDGVARYVVAPALDRAVLDRMDETLTADQDKLRRLVRDGPTRRLHLLGWWTSAAKYHEQLTALVQGASVDIQLILRLSRPESKHLLGYHIEWRTQDFRGLLADPHEYAEPVVVVPIGPLDEPTAKELAGINWDNAM